MIENSETWRDPWLPKDAAPEYETVSEFSIENTGEQGMLFALPDCGESLIISSEQMNSPTMQQQDPLTSNWIKQLSDSTISSSSTVKEETPDPEIEIEKESIFDEKPRISLLQQFRAMAPRSSATFIEKMNMITIEKVKVNVPTIHTKTEQEIASELTLVNQPTLGIKHRKVAAKTIVEIFNDLLAAREELMVKADKLELERVFFKN